MLRAVAEPLIDDVTVKPYAAIDSVHADPVDPMPVHEQGMLLEAFPAQAAAALLAVAGAGSGSPRVVVEVRQAGGALSREGRHPAAFNHRAAGFSLLTVGIAMDPTVATHARELAAAMSSWVTGTVWPDFAPAHEAVSARRAYHPKTLLALAATCAVYDPQGVLARGVAAVRAAMPVPVSQRKDAACRWCQPLTSAGPWPRSDS